MQRVSSITSVSPRDKAIDNAVNKERSRAPRTISMLLTVIPLASALIFVGSAAPPAEGHPVCDGVTHSHLNPFSGTWRVRFSSYAQGRKVLFWEHSTVFDYNQDTGQRTWISGGSITCSG